MKTVSFLLLCFVQLVFLGVAFAQTTPAVAPFLHDTVTYEGTLIPAPAATLPPAASQPTPAPAPKPAPGAAPAASKPQVIDFIQQLTVDTFDSAKQTYTVQQALYLPDGSEKDEQQIATSSDFKSRAEVQSLLGNCAKVGGKSEKITVSGGTFATCLLEDGKGGKTWIGDVPFNIVKQTSIDDSKNVITIEISLYSFGKK